MSSRPDNLIKEEKGLKPYSCDICGKKFARTDSLRRHVKLKRGCLKPDLSKKYVQAIKLNPLGLPRLKKLIKNEDLEYIDLVINEMAYCPIPSYAEEKAAEGENVKLKSEMMENDIIEEAIAPSPSFDLDSMAQSFLLQNPHMN